MARFGLLAVVAAAFSIKRVVQPPALPGPGDAAFAFTNVTVIDGTGSPAAPHRTVVVRDGRIAAIGDASMTLEPGVKPFDAGGKFLVPGLIDTHAHVTCLDWVDRAGAATAVYNDAVSLASLRLLLAYGVTTFVTRVVLRRRRWRCAIAWPAAPSWGRRFSPPATS